MLLNFYPEEGSAGERGAYRDFQSYEDDFSWAFECIRNIPLPTDEIVDYLQAERRRENGSPEATINDVYDTPFAEETTAEASTHFYNASEFEAVRVQEIRDGRAECKLKHGNRKPLKIPCATWFSGVIVKEDGTSKEGFMAYYKGRAYRTWDDPEEGKGKG